MAALTTDIHAPHAAEVGLKTMGMRAAGADTFFRGAIVFKAAGTGQLVATGTAAALVAGVVAERTVTTAANQIVPVHFFGLFLFAFAAATIANSGKTFYMTAGSDNPADLTATATANTNLVGNLIEPKTSGTDGWVLVDANRSLTTT